MDKEWENVKSFQEFFKQPVGDKPQPLTMDRMKKRYKWILEEIDEFLMAEGDMVEQADAMIDVIYFALGALVEMGIKPDPLFKIVHQANMSKISSDGRIHYDSDGKVIKPDTWIDPHDRLTQSINMQLK